MSSSVDDHQNWLAMQYVLGELSDSDCDAFEKRLADDLAICEAVTAATRLMLATRAALLRSPMNSQNVAVATAASVRTDASCVGRDGKNSARSSWLVITATSVAMALVCLFIVRVPADRSNRLASHDPAAAELVSLWHSGMNAGDAESDDLDDLADASGDVTVPGWMLAAVSFEATGLTDGPSDQRQEN